MAENWVRFHLRRNVYSEYQKDRINIYHKSQPEHNRRKNLRYILNKAIIMFYLDEPQTGFKKKPSVDFELIGMQGKNPIYSFKILDEQLTLILDVKQKVLLIRESDIPKSIRPAILKQIDSSEKLILI